jgi:hypothetical protein
MTTSRAILTRSLAKAKTLTIGITFSSLDTLTLNLIGLRTSIITLVDTLELVVITDNNRVTTIRIAREVTSISIARDTRIVRA